LIAADTLDSSTPDDEAGFGAGDAREVDDAFRAVGAVNESDPSGCSEPIALSAMGTIAEWYPAPGDHAGLIRRRRQHDPVLSIRTPRFPDGREIAMIFDIQSRLTPATMTASESVLMADTG